LRESIKKRIDDLDIFFEDNFDNEFISHFERGRYKLKKLIQYEPNLIDEIDNGINMKAFILNPNSKENFFEQDSDIINNNNIKKNKNISKSCKMFPGDNYFKYENLSNKNINTNRTKVNFDNNNNKKYIKYNYKDKKNKWQKDIKNRIYNNYYNKDIRKKITDMNSEDSGANNKENKVKYMDWTENNSEKGNTLSVKSNKTDKNNNSNNNPKGKSNNNKIDGDDFITMNILNESNQSSKNQKNKNGRKQSELNVNNKQVKNKEILFEIKLNKEEYEMFLEQKAKKNKILK
jgi:hypothetical protein